MAFKRQFGTTVRTTSPPSQSTRLTGDHSPNLPSAAITMLDAFLDADMRAWVIPFAFGLAVGALIMWGLS